MYRTPASNPPVHTRPLPRLLAALVVGVAWSVGAGASDVEENRADTGLILQAAEAARAADLAGAARLADRALASCSTKPDAAACKASAHVHLSVEFSRAAAYELALTQARAGAALAARGGPDTRASAQLILAGAAARAGELDEAERAIAAGRAAIDELAEGGDAKEAERTRRLSDMFGGPQAVVYAARGEKVRAAASQRRKVEAMRSFDEKHVDLPDELLTLALMQEEAANPGAARATYTEVIELATELANYDARRLARVALIRLTGEAPSP